MNLIGRWDRLLEWGPRGPRRRWLLDQKWHVLHPLVEDDREWVRVNGVWRPAIAGGALGFGQRPRQLQLGRTGTGGGGSQSTIALSSAYTNNSAGAAIAARIVLPATPTLNNLYFFLTAYTGTAANVNDINWEIRSGSATGTLVTSGTVDPASATGWINISGISQSLTSGTEYWLIIADADGNATDFATVLRNHNASFATGEFSDFNDWSAHSTANGFVAVTNVGAVGNIVARFSDGSSWGSPFTAHASSTSSTNRRGFYLAGFTETINLRGIMVHSGHNNISGMEVYLAATVPGGATEASSTIVTKMATFDIDTGALLRNPYAAAKSTALRVVLTYSAAATVPNKISIGTGAAANLRAAMPYGDGGMYWAEANGTTDWANDDTDGYPYAALLTSDQIAVAASGGSTARQQPQWRWHAR